MHELRMIAADWTVNMAAIDSYESATIVARYNDVSTFEVVLPSLSDGGVALLNAVRPRILFLFDDVVWRSGPLTRVERDVASDGDMLTVNGVDDLVWLRRRLAHPQPGTAAPPYSTTAYDARTGAASQVLAGYVDRNAGPSAVAARQVPGLTVPPPAAFGPVVTTSARYQNLLEFLQPIAKAAGVGFRVRDLAFEVFQPSGHAVFSVELGTLAAWLATLDAPDATYVYVAGGGEGTARLIREYQNPAAVAAWGRIESFQDRRDTTTPAEMDQTGAETLADAIHPPSYELEAIDIAAQTFLTDWNVGDLATVTVGGDVISDVIVEAQVQATGNAPLAVRPVVGGVVLDLAAWRRLASDDRRLRQLERT